MAWFSHHYGGSWYPYDKEPGKKRKNEGESVMDTLVLSCGTGGGHDSAGKAVLEELNNRGHHAEMFNPYTLRSDKLAGGINKAYVSTAKNMPGAFGAVYKAGNLYRRLPFHSPVYFANAPMISAMQEYLSKHPVDVILMPHLFPAEIMTNMKRRGISIPKTIFIATDYVCIPFTEETECDAYIIPSDDGLEDFTARGIQKEKLYPFGIPTLKSFAAEETRQQARQRLGLAMDKKYILITGGSMGGGKIEKAILALEKVIADWEKVEMLVICGNNQELYQRLLTANCCKMTVVGFTDDMPGYMRAANLFITKPGGLSSTEAAVCGVPILHTGAIPGCETRNANYFQSHGMSVVCNASEELPRVVHKLLEDDKLCEQMLLNQRKNINRNAAADICRLAEQMTGQLID